MQIKGISSMATRKLLAELSADFARRTGCEVAMESVGGVDAARRVAAGEAFDLVVLAADAMERLAAGGHLVDGSTLALFSSGIAVAVREGAPRPDLGSEAAVRAAVLAAKSIGYSTGPSGMQLAQLFARWGIADAIRDRIVQAPPGVPVGSLVARGEVALGFQQRAELTDLPGITVLGPLPPPIQIVSTFSAVIGAASTRAGAVRELLDFITSPDSDAVVRRHGMEPAQTTTGSTA